MSGGDPPHGRSYVCWSAPATALAAVPAETRAGRVLNDYAFGGFLIWRGVAPFIDGRADLYGDRFLAAYADIVRPDRVALEKALTTYGATWTIFPPDEPVVGLMDRESGWRRAYADRYAVVHVRTGVAVEGATGPRL